MNGTSIAFLCLALTCATLVNTAQAAGDFGEAARCGSAYLCPFGLLRLPTDAKSVDVPNKLAVVD